MSDAPTIDATRGFTRSASARFRDRCDPCRIAEAQARLRKAMWFIAAVTPNAEFRAIDWLDQRGVFAWTPVERKLRQWNAHTAREWRAFPAARGYVVVGLDEAGAAWRTQWGALAECDAIRFVLGQPPQADCPLPVSAACVELILAMAGEIERQRRPVVAFEEGQAVRLEVGPFADFPGRVVRVSGADARIAILIFGREFEVEARTTNIRSEP